MSNPYMAVAMGQAGCLVRSTAGVLYTAPTGRFWEVIQIVNDTKFHTLTNTIASGDSLANATLASAPTIGAGICLYGNFSEFRLHSGIIVAYFGL
jgi:hypothetical protein